MADLDSCYFCGTIGDGLTELAVVPPRFDPTDEQQRTVVLCTTCRQKLGTVLEPLVDVLGGDGTIDDGPSASAPDAPLSTESVDTERDVRTDGEAANPETTPTAPPPGDAIDTTAFDDPLAPDAEGVTIGNRVADESTDDDSDAATPASESGDSDGPGGSDGPGDSDNTDAGAPDEEPAEFRTVMRLLSNREFPVDRGEIESLASGAYDLEESRAREILDYAVDRGVLAERDGRLHRD